MAVTPSGLAYDYRSGLSLQPFWDPGATVPGAKDALGNPVGTQSQSAPSIWSALPRSNQPLPDGVSPAETIRMAGMRAPGRARVTGGRKKRLDKRPAPGQSGATGADYGTDPAEIRIELHIWTPEHWIDLQLLLPLILPYPSATVTPRAVDVYYPPLAVLSIFKVYITSVEVPQPLDEKSGIWVVRIDAWEFMPPIQTPVQKITTSMTEALANSPRALPDNTAVRTPTP